MRTRPAAAAAIQPVCPAPISDELTAEAKEIAVRTFSALGLYDCARVDMRMDADDKLYVLEANSLPSLGEHGSYLVGAAHVGLDFAAFVNRLVDVASARYFGTPQPPSVDAQAADPSQRGLRVRHPAPRRHGAFAAAVGGGLKPHR